MDLGYSESGISYNKKSIQKYKKAYGGGYLGYKYSHHFETVFYDSTFKLTFTIPELENKIIEFINIIPEDVIYSVLPIIKLKTSKGEYKTITMSKSSIKLTRNTSVELLSRKIKNDLKQTLLTY